MARFQLPTDGRSERDERGDRGEDRLLVPEDHAGQVPCEADGHRRLENRPAPVPEAVDASLQEITETESLVSYPTHTVPSLSTGSSKGVCRL